MPLKKILTAVFPFPFLRRSWTIWLLMDTNLNLILLKGLHCNIKHIIALQFLREFWLHHFSKKKISSDFELLLWYRGVYHQSKQNKNQKRSLLENVGGVFLKKILKVPLGPFYDKSSFLFSWHASGYDPSFKWNID